MAAGPISRIRRTALQTDNLFEINRRELSMMSTLSVLAGFASHRRHNLAVRDDCLLQSRSAYLQVCLGKSTQEALLGGVCLPDLLKFHLKFGSLAPADCEIMQVGQQANRPSVLVGLPLQDM